MSPAPRGADGVPNDGTAAFRRIALILAVAAVYFVSGKIGLSLALVNASATAVWPPTGIALAALLVLGDRVWPGILLGAFLVNLTTAGGALTSAGIAAGNTLEAIVGALLARRFANGPRFVEQPHHIFAFALTAGVLATAVSATIGVATLVLGGLAAPPQVGNIGFTWWLGDASGALVVAPFLVVWASPLRMSWRREHLVERALMLVSVVLAGLLVFGITSFPGSDNLPLEFLCFPPLVWASFRFRQREVATAVVVLSGVAIYGTLHGLGPFARDVPNTSLLLLQAFMAVLSITFLAAAAAMSLRVRAEAGIRNLNEDLERRVEERTGQLSNANRELRRENRQRTRAQRQLEKSESRLREAQRLARIGSWEWDIEHDTLWWSDELYVLYGVDKDSQLSYEGYLERVHPDDRERVRATVEASFRDGRPFSFEHRIVRPDGQVFHMHGQGRVVTDAGGRPLRMMGTGQDITEAKHAEQARATLNREQLARREAEQANQLKDEFLATLSHELRTPLNAIAGWSHLLAEGGLDAAQHAHAVETIQRNARIQAHLISDILDISRMSVGRVELKEQPVALGTVIENAIETMQPIAQAKRVRIVAELGQDRLEVRGDADRLQQVIWNLLSNAIKFSPEQGAVRIALTHGGAWAHVEVTDEGPGIDPEFLPHVFERFRQRDSSNTRRHGGLGLGLAIVSHLVKLHGGRVAAANRNPEPGARLTVSLPLRTMPAGAETVAQPPDALTDQAVAEARTQLEGVDIMLVEDDVDSREFVAALLERCGARVRAFDACEPALAVFCKQPPELLISDIQMPGESGYELIAAVRALPLELGGSVPAAALTAYAAPENVRMSLEAGYDAHLVKPVAFPELVVKLGNLLAAASGRGRAASAAPNARRSGPAS